jgi:hypothetical protein
VKAFFARSVVILSVPAFLFVLALGVRSYRVGDVWAVIHNVYATDHLRTRQCDLGTSRGVILFQSQSATYPLSDPKAKPELAQQFPAGFHPKWITQGPDDLVNLGWGRSRWHRLGFLFKIFQHSSAASASSITQLAVPFWFVALPFAVAPFLWIVGVQRGRRWKERGLCPTCRYDLRASPQRCPECGWVTGQDNVSSQLRHRLSWAIFACQLAAAITFALVNGPTTSRLADVRTHVSAEQQRSKLTTTSPSTRPAAAAPGKPVTASKNKIGPLDISFPPSDSDRKLAAQIDLSQTYVFFHMTSRESMLKNNIASLHIFARKQGRWHSRFVYVRPGEAIAQPGFPTTLKLTELRATPDDLYVTLVDDKGATQTRSAKGDAKDPINRLLIALTMSDTSFDEALFAHRLQTK